MYIYIYIGVIFRYESDLIILKYSHSGRPSLTHTLMTLQLINWGTRHRQTDSFPYFGDRKAVNLTAFRSFRFRRCVNWNWKLVPSKIRSVKIKMNERLFHILRHMVLNVIKYRSVIKYVNMFWNARIHLMLCRKATAYDVVSLNVEIWILLICRYHVVITMTSQWARLRLKSPAPRLLTQAFIQAQIKENVKAPRHWPLYGEFTGDRRIPRTNGQ